jgi:hypothetical protein
MLRTRWPVALFVLWTVFVWVTRISNVLGDDTANKPLALALALSVLVPTVTAGVVLVRARRRALVGAEVRLWQAVAGWTALVWLVRGAEIALDDRGVGFKVVHVAIGAISIALAAATVRVARGEPAPSRSTGVSPSVGAGR